MRSIRRTIEDWEEWVRPYVERKVFQRRKNQYDAGKTESCCYSVKSIPFKLMVERGVSKHIKWNVDGICIKCGKSFTASWNNIWLKKAFRGLEVCGRCSRKEQFTDEWRQHNSEAQKIVQGTPEARTRMSKILKSAWKKDSTIRVRISRSLKETYKDNEELRRKIGDASRRNWKRPEYQEKVTGHGYHHGWFVSKRSRIYFASSWELMFLVWCDENKDVKEYKRNEDVIPYEKPNGGVACYHPDFDMIMLGKPAVVEVKGGRSELDLVERKRVAAERFYQGKKDYVILYKEDLHRMGIMKSSKVVGKWISDLVIQGKVEEYGFGKKH
jgi:hypothetical protein